MEKAYLVPTFHHDIAYLHPEEYYTKGCFAILDEALYILEHNPEYRFSLEQAWLLEQYWDARPENREKLRKFAAEGRLAVEPGLYAVPDMNLPDGESLYMHAALGRKIVEDTLGIKPRVCMIADCWGHHGQIPQIMSSCGYEYYAFSRCMREDVDTQNYVWKGLDGSTIRVHWMSTHYDGIGFPSAAEAENAEEMNWADAGTEGIGKLMERNRKKCGDDPQYLPVGGDLRYPSRMAPALVKELNKRGELPELVFSLPGSALDHIDWTRKQTFDGEFESSMQGTFTTNIFIKQKDRKYAGELYAVEALASVMGKDADLTEAWKLHLKNQFHDIACGTICNHAIRDVEADFRALDHMLTAVRRKISGGVGEKTYFNALPFERTSRVEEGVLTIPALGFAKAKDALKSVSTTASLPLTFENSYYVAQIGKDGYLTSLVSKETGKEIISSNRAPFGVLTMQMDNGDSWWEFGAPNRPDGYNANRPDGLTDFGKSLMAAIEEASVERSDGDGIVVLQKGILKFWITEIRFETRIELSRFSRSVSYTTKFINQSKHLRVRVAFGTNGLTNATRQIPYGCVPHGIGTQASQRFNRLDDGTSAMTLINNGTPSCAPDGDMLLLSLFRAAAMEYKCDSSDSFCIGREFTFRYAVLPGRAEDELTPWREALAFNTPILSGTAEAPVRGIRIKNAFLSALRPADGGVFARIYNPTFKETAAEIAVDGITSACLTDGLGAPVSELSLENGAIRITLTPYKVQGILIKTDR